MPVWDMGRDETDKIIREVGESFYRAAAKAAEPFLTKAVAQVAKKYDLDPGYIMFILLRHISSWQRAAGPNKEALHLLRRLYLMNPVPAAPAPPLNKIPPYEKEGDVDLALAELGVIAATEYTDVLASTLVKSAKEPSERVRQALEADSGKPVTTQRARQVVMHELPLRVKDHPFWFTEPTTLALALESVLG